MILPLSTPVSYTHLDVYKRQKQTYTVSGIMDVENDSRMFQLYVSEAFVEEMARCV